MTNPPDRTAPERIWLNLGNEPITYREAMTGEVSWCVDKQGDWDIEYTRTPMWIPCAERMPEVGCEVIVCWEDGDRTSAFIGADGRWMSESSVFNTSSHPVTHWMPLPPAP